MSNLFTLYKMKYVWNIFICLCCCSLTKCLIPTLTVRRVDQKLIDRRRQDTLEICRLFNEENKYLELVKANTTLNETRRVKREVRNDVDNPLLKQEDIARVENIVEKIYDEIEPKGGHATYRRRNIKKLTKLKEKKHIKNRRFNFAPAELLGPFQEVENTTKLSEKELEISWIKKWKHGIIPFFIDPNTYDSLLSETIIKTFDYLEKVTCIRLQRLRERPTDKQSLESVEWLYITNPLGLRQCVHSNERKPNSGVQMVVLGYDCLSQGEISHEIMHVLGFSHEHTRADRDQHINIMWNNIKPGYKKYFEVRKDDQLLVLPYDYASVLHYPPRAFSKNGQLTVTAQSEIKIGQREALSELDVEKIGMIYGAQCVERNKDYLLKTCPSAVKTNFESVAVRQNDIEKYFENRLWPYGIVNFKIRDQFEFTAEERENIKAVLNHIEKETCIEFRDVSESDESGDEGNDRQIKNDIVVDKVNDNQLKNDTVGDEENDNQIKIDTVVDEENDNQIKIDTVVDKNDNDILNTTEDDATFTVSSEHVTPTENLKLTIKEIPSAEQSNVENKEEEKHDTTSDNVLRLNKNYQNSKRSHTKLKYKIQKSISPNKKKHRNVTSTRRHSDNIIILGRSSEPGCACPPPGRPNQKTVLNINADCFNSVNDLLHMFVHLLGLDHQHNMHDRDSYLHILWDKLTPEIGNEMNEKLPPAASVGFPYDYQSVMHYPWLQIKDGTTNIMYPIWNDGWAMGHWQGLSLTDVDKLNFIYKVECKKRQKEANN